MIEIPQKVTESRTTILKCHGVRSIAQMHDTVAKLTHMVSIIHGSRSLSEKNSQSCLAPYG